MPYVSEGIHQLLDLTPEQLRHDASPFFARVDPRDHKALICSIHASFSANTNWSSEFRIQHPERGIRWLYSSASPRLLENGEYIWDGCCFDITERKTAEENLIRENKRKAIERLAGGIAHDFNNYLSSIALSAELLQSLPEATPRIQTLAAILVTEISSAAAVAKQLLSFTKDQPVQREHLNLVPYLRECADFALRGSSISTVINVADSALKLYTDPNLLRQVIFNLFLNSRQATDNKGIITLTAERGDQLVTLRVSDNGPGISPAHAKKIFEPYYTTKAAGTGLGLHVVRSILHRLGGEICHDSSHRPGASFVITLPVAREAELAA